MKPRTARDYQKIKVADLDHNTIAEMQVPKPKVQRDYCLFSTRYKEIYVPTKYVRSTLEEG